MKPPWAAGSLHSYSTQSDFLKKVLYHGHDFTACLTAQVMRKCLRPVYLDGPEDVKRAIR